MTAMRGLRKIALGGGGVGDRSLSRIHWINEYKERTGWSSMSGILKGDGLRMDDDELLGPSTKGGYVILLLKKDACESREEAIQPFHVRYAQGPWFPIECCRDASVNGEQDAKHSKGKIKLSHQPKRLKSCTMKSEY